MDPRRPRRQQGLHRRLARRSGPTTDLAQGEQLQQPCRLGCHRVAGTAKVASGVDHVGLGSDFDGISVVPVGLEDVSKFPAIASELRRRGWDEADVRKVLGENALRGNAERLYGWSAAR